MIQYIPAVGGNDPNYVQQTNPPDLQNALDNIDGNIVPANNVVDIIPQVLGASRIRLGIREYLRRNRRNRADNDLWNAINCARFRMQINSPPPASIIPAAVFQLQSTDLVG
jgi:hypothetical protein